MESEYWPGVSDSESGHALLLDCTSSLVLLSFDLCTVLVHYCAPFSRRIYYLSQVIIKYTISLSHSKSYSRSLTEQVAQLSQRDRAAVWVSCGANINVVFRIQRTLL